MSEANIHPIWILIQICYNHSFLQSHVDNFVGQIIKYYFEGVSPKIVVFGAPKSFLLSFLSLYNVVVLVLKATIFRLKPTYRNHLKYIFLYKYSSPDALKNHEWAGHFRKTSTSMYCIGIERKVKKPLWGPKNQDLGGNPLQIVLYSYNTKWNFHTRSNSLA